MKEKLKRVFTSTHTGAMGLEGTILTPLMFMTFIVLLYFLFMSLAYITYNNIANTIASELNMRQSGYISAYNYYSSNTPPSVFTYTVVTEDENGQGEYLGIGNITANNGGNYVSNNAADPLLRASYAFIDKYKHGFIIPYNQVTAIHVESTKNISLTSNRSMAGSIIKVTITFKSSILGGKFAPEIKAVGYGVIS